MATNGNNGGNVNYSSPGQSNMGITGNLQNRMAGKEYSERFYREKSGYLDNSITEVQNLLKYYEEISAITKDLSKTEQNRFKKQQDALKEQLKTLEYVKDTREIDFEDSVKLIKESNKLLISGSKEYQRIMEETQDSQSKADKEHLGNLEEASETINKIRENAEKTNQDMKATAKTLNNTSTNFGKSLSNTLKSTGDFVANISNMLSLSSLANNAAEQNLRSKLNIQNSVMKQFGMTSNSQYNQFKSSLVSELKNMNGEMGALFSADDLYSYFERLDDLGITNQKLAEDQLQASIMGNKYLGVSTETQSLIFKFMRNTNSYDMLDKHNKVIAGLLKAQLGVSKEQLDQMSQTVYSDADVIAALGGNAEEYTKNSLAAGSVIDSITGTTGWGDVLTKTLGQLVTSAPDEMGAWAQIFGSDAQTIKQLGLSGQSDKAIEMMINNDFLKGIISSGNTDFIAQAMKDLKIDSTLLNINRYFSDSSKVNEYNSRISDALTSIDSMTDGELKKYIEDTSELTVLEKMQNNLSFVKDKLDSWNSVFNLANIALGIYIASGIAKTVGGIADFFGKGGLKGLLGTNGGGGGVVGTLNKLLGAAGPIALGVASVGAGIAAGWALWNKKQKDDFNDGNNLASGYEKTLIAGGTNEGTAAFQAGISGLTKKKTGTGLGTGFMSDVVANELGIDKSIWKSPSKEFQDTADKFASNFAWDSYNKLKLGRVFFSNTYDSSDNEKALLALLMTLNMNNLSSDSSITEPLKQVLGTNISFSDSDIKDIIKTRHLGIEDLAKGLSILMGTDTYLATSAGKFFAYPSTDEMYKKFYLGDDELQEISGYHKAGLYWVPRDNYKALLHKGEMVLTEQQANAYRNMEKNVGGESDALYSKQQKIVLGKIVSSRTDVGYAGSQMGLPSGWSLTSGYGTYTNLDQNRDGMIDRHRGLDFAAPTGTEIRAANSGKAYLSTESGYGNTIRIATDSGLYNRYGHLSAFAPGLTSGTEVRRGQLIGYVGSTGNSTGPHLHFQVNKTNNERDDINPWPYVMMEIFGGKGSLGVSNVSMSGYNSSTSGSMLPKVTTARFINGASAITSTGGGESNVGGADKVVNSVDGGFNRLIAYLDNISKRQDEQQILLEAFSKSRVSGKDL